MPVRPSRSPKSRPFQARGTGQGLAGLRGRRSRRRPPLRPYPLPPCRRWCARRFPIVSSSMPSPSRSSAQIQDRPNDRAYSLANCLISCTARLTIHLPGLPRSGLPTNDFVSPPARHIEDGDPERPTACGPTAGSHGRALHRRRPCDDRAGRSSAVTPPGVNVCWIGRWGCSASCSVPSR